MKMIDNLLNKVGTDKVLHFLGGATICAFVAFVMMMQEGCIDASTAYGSAFMGTIWVLMLSVIKEFADEQKDWKDLVAGLLGCIPIYIGISIGLLFNALA